MIEFFSALIVVWQLHGQGQERETRAVRLIGVTFFALAAYLAAEGIRDLTSQARPERSIPGIAVTTAALIIMPGLAIAKRRTGRRMRNRAVLACSPTRPETAFCAVTSAAALLGTGLNAALGWWRADPAAALVIAALALREGFDAWENDDN